MKAVVLVGGFGTRLRPLTTSTPKQMLPILDRPMIEWVIDWLAAYGVDEVVLSLGYRPGAFMDAYPRYRYRDVALHYAVESEPLGTAGAIRFAAREIGINETFVAVNGDVLTGINIRKLLLKHRDTGAEGTIALTKVDDPSRYGVVPIDEDGKVLEFVEKPDLADAPSPWINAGTYVLESSVLERIPPGRQVSIERETFPELVAAESLYAQQSGAFWIDAGTPAAYIEAQHALLDQQTGSPTAYQSPTAKVAEGAKVPRSIVMSNVVVEAGATIEGSVLLPGSCVRAGAQVTDSIVGPQALIGPDAVLRELCVIGDGMRVERGSTLTGARVPDNG